MSSAKTPEKRVTDIVRGLAREVRRDQKILEEVTQSVFMNTRELRTKIKDSVRKLEMLGRRKQDINFMLERILGSLTEDLHDVNVVLNAFSQKNPDPLGVVLTELTHDFQKRYRLTDLINQVRRQVAMQEQMMSQQLSMSYGYGGNQDIDTSYLENNIASTVTGMIGPRLEMIRNGLDKRSKELNGIIDKISNSTSNVYTNVQRLIDLINQLLPEHVMNESREILNGMRMDLYKQMGKLRSFHNQARMIQMTGGVLMG